VAFVLDTCVYAQDAGVCPAHKLSAPLVFQQSSMTEDSEAFKNSVLSDMKFLTVAFSIASHFLVDGKDKESLSKTVINEFRNDLSFIKNLGIIKGLHKVDISEDEIVTIPFWTEKGEYKARVCLKNKFKAPERKDIEWLTSDKFAIQIEKSMYSSDLETDIDLLMELAKTHPETALALLWDYFEEMQKAFLDWKRRIADFKDADRYPVGSNPVHSWIIHRDYAEGRMVTAAQYIAMLEKNKDKKEKILKVLLKGSRDFYRLEKAASGLGFIFDKTAINRLLDISDENTVLFMIATNGKNILYRATPSRFRKTKTEWEGADHTGSGGYMREYVAEGRGEITDPLEGAFRGTISNSLDSKEGFIRLDIPVTSKQIDAYCKSKGIKKEDFAVYVTNEFIEILELFSEIADPEKPFIVPDGLREVLKEMDINIPDKGLTIGEVIKIISEDALDEFSNDEDEEIAIPLGALTSKIILVPKLGIHGRLATKIVEKAKEFPEAEVFIIKGNKKVSCKSITELMMLGASKGAELILYATGKQSAEVFGEIALMLESEEGEIGEPEPIGEVSDEDAFLDAVNSILNMLINSEKLKEISDFEEFENYVITENPELSEIVQEKYKRNEVFQVLLAYLKETDQTGNIHPRVMIDFRWPEDIYKSSKLDYYTSLGIRYFLEFIIKHMPPHICTSEEIEEYAREKFPMVTYNFRSMDIQFLIVRIVNDGHIDCPFVRRIVRQKKISEKQRKRTVSTKIIVPQEGVDVNQLRAIVNMMPGEYPRSKNRNIIKSGIKAYLKDLNELIFLDIKGGDELTIEFSGENPEKTVKEITRIITGESHNPREGSVKHESEDKEILIKKASLSSSSELNFSNIASAAEESILKDAIFLVFISADKKIHFRYGPQKKITGYRGTRSFEVAQHYDAVKTGGWATVDDYDYAEFKEGEYKSKPPYFRGTYQAPRDGGVSFIRIDLPINQKFYCSAKGIALSDYSDAIFYDYFTILNMLHRTSKISGKIKLVVNDDMRVLLRSKGLEIPDEISLKKAVLLMKKKLPKGSPADCLKAIYYGRFGNLREKTDISITEDLIPLRGSFKKSTVYKEVEMLREGGIFVEGTRPHTVQLRDEVRKIAPIDMDKILEIPELNKYEMDDDEIARVKKMIDDQIEINRLYHIVESVLREGRGETIGKILYGYEGKIDDVINKYLNLLRHHCEYAWKSSPGPIIVGVHFNSVEETYSKLLALTKDKRHLAKAMEVVSEYHYAENDKEAVTKRQDMLEKIFKLKPHLYPEEMRVLFRRDIDKSLDDCVFFGTLINDGESLIARSIPSRVYTGLRTSYENYSDHFGTFTGTSTSSVSGRITPEDIEGGAYFRGTYSVGGEPFIRLDEPKGPEAYCAIREIEISEYKDAMVGEYIKILNMLVRVVDTPENLKLVVDDNIRTLLKSKDLDLPDEVSLEKAVMLIKNAGKQNGIKQAQKTLKAIIPSMGTCYGIRLNAEAKKAIYTLGEDFSPDSINLLLLFSYEHTLLFSIAKTEDGFRYLTTSREYGGYASGKLEYTGAYNHDGTPALSISGGMTPDKVEMPKAVSSAFRGTISGKSLSNRYTFLRLDPPMTNRQIKAYCKEKNIGKEDFPNSIISDCISILEEFSKMCDKNITLILHDNLRKCYAENGVEISERVTLGVALDIIRGAEKEEQKDEPDKKLVIPEGAGVKKVTVMPEPGIHARVAGKIVVKAKEFPDAEVKIVMGEKEAFCDSISQLMMLGASQGAEVTLYATGEDKAKALKAIANILEREDEYAKKEDSGKMRLQQIKEEMIGVHDMNIDLTPSLEKGKTLWHVVPRELLPNSTREIEFIKELERMQDEVKDLREKIKFVTRGNLAREVRALAEDKDNIIDVAFDGVVTKEEFTGLPSGVKALVFEGQEGGYSDFKHFEVVIAALRALQKGNMDKLIELYNLFSKEDLTESAEELMKYIDDPEELSRHIRINLGPVEIKDPDELKELNKLLLRFLQAA